MLNRKHRKNKIKKILRTGLVVTVAALAAFGIARWHEQQHDVSSEALAAIDSVARLSPGRIADSIAKSYEMMLRTELDYYLERHNVADEGYEVVAAFANGQRYNLPVDTIPVMNVGRWKDHKRQGTAISRDSMGRLIIGNWHADTLVSGIRIDSTGYYQGDFSGGKASGHGAYVGCDHTYFEGHWKDGLQDGFGLQLLANDFVAVLKTGQWQAGQYRGERMNYTSERIYGIDISRYQHGHGRKKYPIRWPQVRITHLGRKSKKQISGVVDYPVEFCYIKSTEGTSIRNKYFLQDYMAAKRQGIHTGAYHFFSTRTAGAAQANYFLNHTLLRKGDLPPVLDIEPTDADIRKMGGAAALFRHIRAWLKPVEQRTKVKPILYVNQRFVNKYLSEAPDLKRDYKVWIARYGEYKPDVKLVVWQLSPDGRVRGITGDVDINVFNGYRPQFEAFIEHETIK